MDLSVIRDATVPLVVDFTAGGQTYTVNLEVYAAGFDRIVAADIEKDNSDDSVASNAARAISALVHSWDLTYKGEPIAIESHEIISKVPMTLLYRISEVAGEHYKKDDPTPAEESQTSSALAASTDE